MTDRKQDAGAAPALPDRLRYVAVEGVIGAGKTSLARRLADRFGGQLVLEEFEENPFLPSFYEDAERWGFHTQLAFLASRFRQQKAMGARDLFRPLLVSDYTFDKDRIFAHINLKGDELRLYESVYTLMEPATPQPDLVVYLRSSTERLQRNIAQRGRVYELGMQASYLETLAEAYDYYFFRYSKSALLVVDASRIDFVGRPAEFEELAARIAAMPASGTVYFNPRSESEPGWPAERS